MELQENDVFIQEQASSEQPTEQTSSCPGCPETQEGKKAFIEKEIRPLVAKIFDICKANDIPFFFAVEAVGCPDLEKEADLYSSFTTAYSGGNASDLMSIVRALYTNKELAPEALALIDVLALS